MYPTTRLIVNTGATGRVQVVSGSVHDHVCLFWKLALTHTNRVNYITLLETASSCESGEIRTGFVKSGILTAVCDEEVTRADSYARAYPPTNAGDRRRRRLCGVCSMYPDSRFG